MLILYRSGKQENIIADFQSHWKTSNYVLKHFFLPLILMDYCLAEIQSLLP